MTLGNYMFFFFKNCGKKYAYNRYTNNQFIKFRCLFFKLLVIFKEVFKIKTF